MKLSQETEKLLIMKLLGMEPATASSDNGSITGRTVMVRTYSAGVHFGELVSMKGKEVVLENAQRVHYWDGACSLSQLAKEGSKKLSNSRISVVVDSIILTEAIEVIPMTLNAVENLRGADIWKK